MKSATLFLALFVAIFFPVLSGCKGTTAAKKDKGAQVVATVNGVAITGDDILLRLGGHDEFMSTPMKNETLDDLIKDELLYQKGVKLGLDKDERFQGMVRAMERKIAAYKRAEIARRVRDTQIAGKVNTTDQDTKDYYDKHAEDIGTDLHLSVLQFRDQAQARDAAAKIRAGTPFEKVSPADSPHMLKGAGARDVGFLHWNQLPTEWLRPVYGLKKGEISDVLTSREGIYIVKLIDKRKNKDGSFEKMRASITNRVNSMKITEAYDHYVEQLKKEATIKRY